MSGSDKKWESSRLHSRITRRQAIKAGGVAALGLAFSKPIVDTLRPRPVSANVSFGTGGNPVPPPAPFTLTLQVGSASRIRRETPDPNVSPTLPFADQVLSPSVLAILRDFSDANDPIDRIGRSLLYFDIAPVVPGSAISSALLTMVCVGGLSFAPLTTAHNILTPTNPPSYAGPIPSWNGTSVRWNSQSAPDGTGAFTPSIDHDSAVEASGVSAPAGTSYSFFGDLTFDLTTLVQDWVSGARVNNGVLLKLGNELTEASIFCWPPGATVEPRLIINGSTGGSFD